MSSDPARQGKLVEPTPEELRNGWTRERLNRYLRERAAQQESYAAEGKAKQPSARSETTVKFDPHKWGQG